MRTPVLLMSLLPDDRNHTRIQSNVFQLQTAEPEAYRVSSAKDQRARERD